jgi:transposase
MTPLLNIAAWRETQEPVAYRTWAVEFKSRVQQSLQQWLGKAGYEAGKLLRSLRDDAIAMVVLP